MCEGLFLCARQTGIWFERRYKTAMTIGLFFYRLGTWLLWPFSGLILSQRIRSGKEAEHRINERLAKNLPLRPGGQLVWLHGASVGESLMLVELAAQMIKSRNNLALLFSCQTLTGAETISRALANRAEFQKVWYTQIMAPLDTPPAANRFVKHWSPDLTVIAEGEIWPNLISALKKRNHRTALVNARMTDKSIKGWARWPETAQQVFTKFDVILASDTRSEKGLRELSGRDVQLAGNLKSSLPPPDADLTELQQLEDAVGDRNVLLAASTHDGEEAIIIDAVMQMPDRPLTIIAPRHPDRGDWVENLIQCSNLKYARRSDDDPIREDTDILLADTLGEMGLWYRLADTVYIGGGHAPGIGGHNPLEALRLAKPVLSGPSVFNFDDVVRDLKELGAITIVLGAEDIVQHFPARAPTKDILQRLEERAFAPMQRTLDSLLPLLSKAPGATV